jgi:FkbM family methyltransferase
MRKNIVLKIFLDPFLAVFPLIARTLKAHLDTREYEKCIRDLVKNGVDLNVIYDIGAHKGRWTKWHQKILKNKKFVLFEANEIHRKKLEKICCDFFIQVLASENKQLKFYRKGGTGDSIYLENTDHYSGAYDVVMAKTVDTLVSEKGLSPPNFIKLDVQGAELDILRGAKNALNSCNVILMECPVVQYNIGAPKLETYLNFMKEIDFLPLKIFEQHIDSGLLIQIDILFISREAYEVSLKSRKLPKYLISQ